MRPNLGKGVVRAPGNASCWLPGHQDASPTSLGHSPTPARLLGLHALGLQVKLRGEALSPTAPFSLQPRGPSAGQGGLHRPTREMSAGCSGATAPGCHRSNPDRLGCSTGHGGAPGRHAGASGWPLDWVPSGLVAFTTFLGSPHMIKKQDYISITTLFFGTMITDNIGGIDL